MKSSKHLAIEEDLIAITTNLIRITKSIPKPAEIMFQYLESYMKIGDGLILDLFELLNYYLIHGSLFILNDPIKINMVRYYIKFR